MNKLLASDRIYISRSKIRNAGRGVFARADIKKGHIIERCPIIELHKHEVNINKSLLPTYIYFLGRNKKRLIVALGFGSIYNHSRKPNAKYKENYKQKIIDFIAVNAIKTHEEITVNYNQGNQKDKTPLWFETYL